LGLQPKMGGRFHLKLNIVWKPIEKKYSDGNVKRTLKRRSKVLEIVKRETNATGKILLGGNQSFGRASRLAVRAGLFGRSRLGCVRLSGDVLPVYGGVEVGWRGRKKRSERYAGGF